MKHKALTLAFLLLAVPAWAQQDWQVRGLCDLRKNAGEARADACAQSASEVLMLLPEKAGPGDLAVVAELTDNLAKAGVGWEAPCRDASHCPETAYTLRYAMVSRKVATIAKEKVFTALICREGFSETPQDASACRRKLLKVVGELAARARKENALLAVLKLSGQEEGVTPDSAKVAGFELVYAFVQIPDVLPMAGNDPKAVASQTVAVLAGPEEYPTVSVPATVAAASASPDNTGGMVFQVAALATVTQAESVADRLRATGVEANFEQVEVNGREVYRVLAMGQGNPETFRQKLAGLGYAGAIVKR